MSALVNPKYPVDRVANSGTIGIGLHTTATFVEINELLAISLLRM